ncbi:MAG: MFS transporter [Patescibacteria group bacterium]
MFRIRKPKVNRVVLTLVYADLIFYTAVGLVTPIVAVFYVDHVNGGSVALAGLATATFWIVKSIVQIPVSLYADSHKGEGDDFSMMIVGFVIAALVPFFYYLFVTQAWQVYLMEIISGIGYGLSVPTYLAMFTRHIDRQKENFEWTLHSNAVGLGYAAAAAIGGLIAERFGFGAMFLMTSAIMFLTPVVLLFIRHDIERFDGLNRTDPNVGMQRKKLPTHT